MDREHSWVNLLDIRLNESGFSYSILNSSISGDTSQGGLARLPRLLIDINPKSSLLSSEPMTVYVA